MYSASRNEKICLFLYAVHALNKLPYSKLDSRSVGIREGVVFLTYSSLIASSEKGRSRLQQLVQWCGSGYDGLVIFDEVPRLCFLGSVVCCYILIDAINVPWFQCTLLSFIAKVEWLHCSATKLKIWYRKLEVSQHVLGKQSLSFRFVS